MTAVEQTRHLATETPGPKSSVLITAAVSRGGATATADIPAQTDQETHP